METKNPDWPALAALFHYYVCRFGHGVADSDGGLFLNSTTFTPLGIEGICPATDHTVPFTSAGAATPPSDVAFADARTHRLLGDGSSLNYRQLSGVSLVAKMRDSLSRDRPVVIGFRLPAGYPDSFLEPGFLWSDPNVSKDVGGHCVLAVGFSDARSAIRIHDCQGRSAFDAGEWWMGYRVVDSPSFLTVAFELT